MQNVTRGKVWGNTAKLFSLNNVEIHRIEVEKGGYCSKHSHKSKYNLFYVEDGELEIYIYRTDAGEAIRDETVLGAGGSTYVEPGVPHMFKANQRTIAFEIYWVELDERDIRRENVGGKADL